MHVRLPFQPAWREAVLAGRKTTTVRTRRYGSAGDTFDVEGVRFVLVEVAASPLAAARDACWEDEGVASPARFEAVWTANHPTRGFRATDTVWVHRFRRA